MKKKVKFVFNTGASWIHPQAKGDTDYSFYKVDEIYLAGDFNHWDQKSIPVFNRQVTLELDCGVYEFKFIVNGQWRLTEGAQVCLSPMGTRNNRIVVNDNDKEPIDILERSKRVNFCITPIEGENFHYFVVGDFNDWDIHASEMKLSLVKNDGKLYYCTSLYPGRYEYKYYIARYYSDGSGKWVISKSDSTLETANGEDTNATIYVG